MINTFERDGIRFRYPANWTVEATESGPDESGWTVVVQSPETAFLLVSLRPDADNPAGLADQTLQALCGDYQELDSENRVETLAGVVAIGYDIDFMTVDTPITCRTRCLETPAGPLLVMAQTSEFDRSRNDPVLRAICASLTIAEE